MNARVDIGNLRDGLRPLKRPALHHIGCQDLGIYIYIYGKEDTNNPDSAIMVRNSLEMYCTGEPEGGVSRNCTRDLTTSASSSAGIHINKSMNSTEWITREPVGNLKYGDITT
jgi:hypothetical protein